MKKITIILKTMFLTVVVLVMVQSCIPTTPVGGNPTLINGFDINISSTVNALDQFNYNSQTDTLIIDGDSIEFSTAYTSSSSFGGLSQYINIIPVSNVDAYEYVTNAEDVTLPGYQFYFAHVFSSGVTINNTLDSTKQWKSVKNSYPYKLGINGGTIFPSVYQLMSLPIDVDQYLVFRKFKLTGYQYYWVKIRYTDNLNLHLTYTLSVINGRYQMNSIITGQ